MKTLLVVVIASFVASASAKATLLEEHPYPGYNCGSQPDGNYEHPSDCTRFVSCSGGISSERDCANCDVHPVRCPTGRLVYNSTVDACLWADETTCAGSGGGPATPTVRTTTTTKATPAPTVPTPTPTVPTPPQTPKPGNDCNPQECRNDGWCQDYWRCDKNTGKWVNETCGPNLVWNPVNGGQIHGGNCDDWENLPPHIQQEYQNDPECFGCYWRADGECQEHYFYQPPNGTTKNPLQLNCAPGLVFVLEKETCLRCEDVDRADGSGKCCTP